MYILTQERDRIINLNQMAMLDILESSGEIYATQDVYTNEGNFISIGKYADPRSALDDILIALKNGNKIYEMPESDFI